MTLQRLEGIIAPNLTPFADDLSIASDLYVAHAKRLMADGCVGLAPFGTTGEALSVGRDERVAMLEALIAAGVAPDRLIPGTGLSNLPDTVHLTRHAIEMGCGGAMILPPFYFKGVSDDGLFAYFEALIRHVGHPDLRIYLYHIPQVAGVGLPIPLVTRLKAAFPDVIVGIKDSSGDWSNTQALLNIPDLVVYPGAELPVIEAMDLGAPGCISATANLNAASLADLIGTFHAGDRAGAVQRHVQAKAVRLAVQGYAPIPAQKRLLAMWTGDARWANVRPPLEPLSEADGVRLMEELAEAGFKWPEAA